MSNNRNQTSAKCTTILLGAFCLLFCVFVLVHKTKADDWPTQAEQVMPTAITDNILLQKKIQSLDSTITVLQEKLKYCQS